jgi:Fur family ferric uptake transcriptional regulator
VPWFENINLVKNQAHYEKSYFDKHDHIIMTDTGEVIEFCDPRIQTIKKTIEEIFDIEITNHPCIYMELRKPNETAIEDITKKNCKTLIYVSIKKLTTNNKIE